MCEAMMAHHHWKIERYIFPSIPAFQVRIQRFAVTKLGCARLDIWGEQRAVPSSLSKVLRLRFARTSLLSRGILPVLRRSGSRQEGGSQGRRSKHALGDCSSLWQVHKTGQIGGERDSSTHCRTGVKKLWERLLLKIRFREPSFTVQHKAPRSVSSQVCLPDMPSKQDCKKPALCGCLLTTSQRLGRDCSPGAGKKASFFIIWRENMWTDKVQVSLVK